MKIRLENISNRASLIETLYHDYGLDREKVQLGSNNSIVINGEIQDSYYILRCIDQVIKCQKRKIM